MANNFQLISAPDAPGAERVMRHIRFSEGKGLVEARKVDPVTDAEGYVIAFRYRARRALPTLHPARPSGAGGAIPRCETAFSQPEVEAIVGFHGESRTEGLTDDQRSERVKQNLDAEDLVERSRMKLRVYRRTH